MKKLTDVLKYNKEIQKKNQGAVINQNNPIKGNSINLQKLTGTTYVPETERKQTTTLEAIAYNRQKEREVQYQKDNNEVIYNGFKSSFIDEDAYNWRRNTRDSSIPAYGSKNFFINRKNELATQIQRESAQLPQLTGVEESGYNLYKTNPDVLRYGTDEQKIAYNYYSTLDRKRNRLNALSAEYNDVLGILNANETKGVHLNKEGKVDTRSGISEAQREKNEYGVVQDFYKKDYSFSPISILPEARAGDEQARYDRNMETEGKIVLAGDKIKAYKYYDKNKDNKYTDGLFGRIGANFKSGTIGEKIAETGANSWEYATDDIEAAQVYQQLDKRLRENNKEAYKDNNAFDTFVSTLSNYAPQFINQKKAEIKGKIAGAALGYFMGNAGAGARIGGAAASSADMFRRVAGSQYVELLQNSDMSEEDIKIMATNTALIESALEFGLSYIADKLIFGGKTVGKKLGAEKLEDGIISILKKGRMSNKGIQVAVNGIKFIGKQAIEGIGEGTEEFLQTGTEIVARKHAEKGETLSAVELLKETFDFSSYTKEDFAQMKSAGLAAFIISAGSTGTMKSAVSSYMDAVDVVKTEEFGKMIKQAKLSDEYIADAVTICLNSENAEVRGLARKIDNAMQNNQIVSDKDIGRLFKYSTLVEKHNPFEITGGYVEKELKLEQSKSGLVTVYSKDWALGPDSAPVKVIEGLAKLSNSKIVIEDLEAVEVTDENGDKKLVDNMGFVQDGVIHINSANVKTRLGAMVTLHEVTHNIENSDLYSAYKKLAFDILYGGENTDSYKEAYNTIAERYGDKVSSKEDIDKELVANFTMTRLDEQVINRIVNQNRNVAVKIYNALKNAYNKVENFITGTEQDLSDIERALDIFDRALAERRETIDNSDLTPFVDEEGKVRFGDGEGGIKYYLGDFKHQVDAVLDKEAPEKLKSGLSVYVGKTTKLLRKAGLDDLPMLMNQGHLRDINHEKTPDNIHYHGLDIETIKQLPLQLKEPVMIYDSISPHKKENTVCVVTSLTDKDGYPVIVTIRANSDEGGNRYIDVSLEERKADKTNFVTSMYGKDNFWSHIEEVVDNDAMIYMNKNKTQRLASDNELYLLTRLDKLGYDNIIHQSRNIVNNNDMQKSQNNAQGSNGKQHLLGGETSVVANNKTLAEARRMNLKGEPQAEIFKKTGWYKGLDKKWKKEIDPNDAELFKTDNKQYALGGEVKIDKADVDAVQSIGATKGRISVNAFDNNDIKATESFARKYYAELKEKSPFFRAWFGDWRENDKTPITVATKKDSTRGTTVNKDTGWNVQVSGQVFNETKVHQATKNRYAVKYLDYINSIVENAVLLDSYVIDKPKSHNSAMMHSLYALVNDSAGEELVKLYVEELNDVNENGTINRAYQLHDIIKIPTASVRVQNNLSSLTNTASTSYTVTDLFNFVKQNDSEFNPKPSSLLVDEDGKPLIVYHGTDAKFDAFDMTKGRANMDIQGAFFSPWELDAHGYGENVGAGNINWDEVIEACREANVPYAVVEQDTCDGDPFDSLKMSYDYLVPKYFEK